MAIPPLDNEGFLPPGIYDCTFVEIQERFGQFNGSDCRQKLCQKLEAFVNATQRANLGAWLIVNGSFTTDKQEPGDVDLVVVLPRAHDKKVATEGFGLFSGSYITSLIVTYEQSHSRCGSNPRANR